VNRNSPVKLGTWPSDLDGGSAPNLYSPWTFGLYTNFGRLPFRGRVPSVGTLPEIRNSISPGGTDRWGVRPEQRSVFRRPCG
jgi:hypothetical protein